MAGKQLDRFATIFCAKDLDERVDGLYNFCEDFLVVRIVISVKDHHSLSNVFLARIWPE
jgi:hypothetical protein